MFLEQQINIRMISEGCDTEDWSNDTENSALHHRNKLHLKIYSYRKEFISQYYTFYVIFDAAQTIKKKFRPQTFER